MKQGWSGRREPNPRMQLGKLDGMKPSMTWLQNSRLFAFNTINGLDRRSRAAKEKGPPKQGRYGSGRPVNSDGHRRVPSVSRAGSAQHSIFIAA